MMHDAAALLQLQEEVDELKKKSQATDEKLEMTQREFEELRRNKREENHVLHHQILSLNGAGNSQS
jgi:peptidoglycan hydrolase CwlO-like protein